MDRARDVLGELARRRLLLGMSFSEVARRSGLSMPVVQRILDGRYRDPSFPKVVAIAEALGTTFEPKGIPIREMQEQAARTKARRIVQLVQGTSGLESQAVSGAALAAMEEQTVHELLAGSRRYLWAEQ